MPFCYYEESSRACLGMSRLYGISKISIRGSHPASQFCRSLRTFVAVFAPLSQQTRSSRYNEKYHAREILRVLEECQIPG